MFGRAEGKKLSRLSHSVAAVVEGRSPGGIPPRDCHVHVQQTKGGHPRNGVEARIGHVYGILRSWKHTIRVGLVGYPLFGPMIKRPAGPACTTWSIAYLLPRAYVSTHSRARCACGAGGVRWPSAPLLYEVSYHLSLYQESKPQVPKRGYAEGADATSWEVRDGLPG